MDDVIRLSISEASRLFGVSQRTLRRAITNELVNYVVVQGRYKISFDSLLKWSQSSTLTQQKRDTLGIGQYVGHWKINNTLYSPNPKRVIEKTERTAKSSLPKAPAEPKVASTKPTPVKPAPMVATPVNTSPAPTAPTAPATPKDDIPELRWD